MTIKERLAGYFIEKAFALLPEPHDNHLMSALIKQAIKDLKLTNNGLIYIPPFDVFTDQDDNLYISDFPCPHCEENIEMVHIKPIVENTPIRNSLWPRFKRPKGSNS